MFCPQCHSLLDLPDAQLLIRCLTCQYRVKFSADDDRLEKFATSTKYNNFARNELIEEEEEEETASQRAKVDETCPKCRHPEMYFYTMQMRSVDEGQTVFYECVKCRHTMQVDS